MPELDKETTKEAVREALKEWLNEKYAEFGRWSLHGLMALALAGLVYLALQRYGINK